MRDKRVFSRGAWTINVVMVMSSIAPPWQGHWCSCCSTAFIWQRPGWRWRHTTTMLMSSSKWRLIIFRSCTLTSLFFVASFKAARTNRFSIPISLVLEDDLHSGIIAEMLPNKSLGFSLRTWTCGSMLRDGLFNSIIGPTRQNNGSMVHCGSFK